MKTLLVPLFAATLAAVANAAEPPVRDGLIVHLDAADQIRARQGASLAPLTNHSPLDRWVDGAEGAEPARQFSPGSRPVFHGADGEAFLRFDGEDDYLTLSRARELAPELTVFVLAAPLANAGNFSGLFATAEAGKNDYTSGLNLDLGPLPTGQLSVLNIETAGAGGFLDFLEPGRNLAADLPFGRFHVFTVRSRIGERGNEVFLDGLPLGERTRLESNIGLDEMMVGARHYSNDPGQPPFAQSFFKGDLATVLVYRRALDDSERKAVEQWLFSRTPALNALASGASGHALESLADPPVVQMLVPGFRVDELPVKLTNLTGLRYRHDGKLVALGYDGRLHLLTDTDADGTEDRAEIFWDQSVLRGAIGIALLPKDDPRGDGVFVASKGKVSLILDRDRDGTGDEEIVAASGWKENFTNVDATGMALDPKDGSLYFCLGVENFANAYLIDPATGKSAFELGTDRGTIQRVSADFSKRETVCTGVRFACALAFNREGDLFASEQEGATWLPNGNPYDELLHIVPGRHYGFPPRHPKHLPNVVDEPSTFDYGPQHQSTVGMVFNDPVNGGPTFGPAFWNGDALVCGESRGKLYRTKLVKTESGYVAQNALIGCLTMLTVDACVSPRGDLIVACHSGPPDWGTGPAGEGRIFRVHYAKPKIPKIPQPVLAWASGPDEFRIAFDRELDPAEWADALRKVRIEAGAYVSPGDRYEVIRPGYQVVREQMGAPRRWVEVLGLTLTADRRTLVLRVARQTEDTGYAVTLPVPESWRAESAIAQRAEMDVAVRLNGVVVKPDDGSPAAAEFGDRSIVLPHPSLEVSKALTMGSAEHENYLHKLESSRDVTSFLRTLPLGIVRPTEIALHSRFVISERGEIKLSNIFVPSIQPGSSIDWDPSTDAFASQTMKVDFDFANDTTGSVLPTLVGDVSADGWQMFDYHTYSGKMQYRLDERVRPIPLNRLRVPWARSEAAPPEAGERDDVHGNWLAGRRIFFGKGACFTCHAARGAGTAFGPDLTNLVHRDRDSVLKDILEPAATINPDQTGSLVRLKNGTEVPGLVRTLDEEKLVLALPGGIANEWPRDQVASIEPMKTSLMPAEFGQNLTETEREDLLTFLLTTPLEPTTITRTDPPVPAPRAAAEIAPFLAVPSDATERKPLRILLSADEKDHGVDEHDYPLWLARWSKLLALAESVTVDTCMGFPPREKLDATDVIVFYGRNAEWSLSAAKALDVFQKRGGGLVYLHWAMEGRELAPALAERIGLATGGLAYRHGELDLVFPDRAHPITRGFEPLHLTDEAYWKFNGDPARVSVLATSVEEGNAETQLWTFEKHGARVFGCIPGHYMWTFDDPLYRILVLRGIAWVAQDQDVDRLLELATVGARIAP